MARPKQTPAPSPLVTVKRDPDAEDPTLHTPAPLPRKRRRRGGPPPVTPTQLPLTPLQTPQTIPSGSSVAVLTPPTATAADGGADAGPSEKRVRRGLAPYARPAAAEPSSLWLNRCRLGGILHELARAHRWRDAASVVSTLLRSSPKPVGSFQETRCLFVVAMEIYKRLAEDSGMQQGSRSLYYLRTQKMFDVWMQKLFWFPSSPKKRLVTLELALFYLSQGNIDNAYNATRTLIGKEGLQTEPILNLIHGLISYDKWYSGLPKDMQVEEFDVYNELCAGSMASNGCEESDILDNSDDNSISVHDASLPACSSESSINNEDIERKMNAKPYFVRPKEENDTLNESMIGKDFRSMFFINSDSPTCGLDKTLLPLRLNPATGTSNDCFESYWKYKSAPNNFYEDASKCLGLALHSDPPVMAALLPLIQAGLLFSSFDVVQLLLLGDKLKDALKEVENACNNSSTALPFRLKGRLLEYSDHNQVSTISSCYEEALRRDPTCSYSIERLITMHRKGLYNTIQLLESIALHLDSSNGKPCIWEELVSCFLRLFSDWTADYGDRISCNNVRGDKALRAFSNFSSVFFEPFTRESWKARCRWWMHHHFSQKAYMTGTLTGDCKLLAAKAACASHLFGPEFPYVKEVGSYLDKQEVLDEMSFVSINKQNSVRLLQTLEKLTS